MYPLKAPTFPDDFRVLYADGGASFWHWHPDAPPDYDGTWPAGEEPPPWSGGLLISSKDLVRAELVRGEAVVVVWEYGPETESGPYLQTGPDDWAIQDAIDNVIAEVNEAHSMGAP